MEKKLIESGVLKLSVRDSLHISAKERSHYKNELAERSRRQFEHAAPGCAHCASAKMEVYEDIASMTHHYAFRCSNDRNVSLFACPDGERFQRRGAEWVKVVPVKFEAKLSGTGITNMWVDEYADTEETSRKNANHHLNANWNVDYNLKPTPKKAPPDLPATTVDAW